MERFSGVDTIPRTVDTAVTLVIGLVLVIVVPIAWKWWVCGATLIMTAASFGSCYRVTVDDLGILVEWKRFWVLTFKQRRYRLDANVDLYHCWDIGLDVPPTGIYIVTTFLADDLSVEPFGPHRPLAAIEQLRDDIQAAIERARERVETEQRELRGPLTAFADSIEMFQRDRGPSGRFLRGRATATIEIAGVQIPEDSIIEINTPSTWIDPRRDDTLRHVVLSRPTWVPALRREVMAGVHLIFDEKLTYVCRVTRISGGAIEIDGFHCKWSPGVSLGPDGRVSGFTLAKPWTIPTCTVPAGVFVTQRSARRRGYRWAVMLKDPLWLRGVVLRERDWLYLAEDGSLVSFGRGRGHVRVGNKTVSCEAGAIPLTADGHIDLAGCARRKIPITSD